MAYVQTPIVLQIKVVTLILCELKDGKELYRQLVEHGEVFSLRSIELCPYTVELSVLVCTRIPVCLFPKPSKPKGKQHIPTLHLASHDFAWNGSGAVYMTIGWYDFFFSKLLGSCVNYIVKSHYLYFVFVR